MLRSRFVAALGLALLVGTVAVAPVGAATKIIPCSGTCGSYSTFDQSGGPYGAVCTYETGSFDLDTIKVKPPRIYGPYNGATKVQWKFNILRTTTFGPPWKGIFNSTWQNGMASKTSYASGFSSRTWNASDPNPTGWFKVRILLRWKNAAGYTVGNAKVEYDYYQRKWMSSTNPSTDYCIQDW
jgi:hypothetical protein